VTASVNSPEATPLVTSWAAPSWAQTAAQLSKRHCSRSAEPSAAWAAASMSAIADSRAAQAAFSNRAQARTRSPEDRAAAMEAMNCSNTLSKLIVRREPDH